MPNTKSAIKAMRASRRKRGINLVTIRKYKDAVKLVRQAVDSKKSKTEALKLLSLAFAQLDKAAKKHVMKKNKASRFKSRLALAVEKLG